MNETDAQQLIECLVPAPPSDALLRRLLAARPVCAPPAPRPVMVRIFPRLLAAAAAVAVCGAAVWFSFPDTPAPAIAAKPREASAPEITAIRYLPPPQSSRQLLGVRDAGFTRDAQQRPVRLMRATWLDHDLYDRGDGSPAEHDSRVREELLPVTLTTY